MKKLYLKNWEFNSYRILNEIRKEIEKKGGFLVNSYPHISKKEKIKIYDRTFLEAERETSANLAANPNLLEYNKKYFSHYYEALEKNYKSVKIVENTSFLHFYYEGYIYYIQFDSNPFFPHYIQKQKAEKVNDEYITRYSYYLEDIEIDDLPSFQYISDWEIKKHSKKIIEIILKRKESKKVTEKKRIRNYYNNSYHYENILKQKTIKYKKIEY